MSVRRSIEFPEKVRIWCVGLTPIGKALTDRVLERPALQGNIFHMPHFRPLGDGLYELRFSREDVNRRTTYVSDPDRRAATPMTFRKQRQNE